MLIQDIILKKRNGHPLSTEEIDFFVKGYTAGVIPDYQASALLMAVWFAQMNERETADLTRAIADSGEIVDLSTIDGVKIDKHSTGGVADTTTLITAPLAAACGGRVAKISGRGLGHTGGTIDKLESIPGLDPMLAMDDFIRVVSACGLAIISQSPNLVPADKLLYGLRDVTGTVDNVSLISSSIMSKKLAAGADVIVLDVKCGNGAFMRSVDQARTLAAMMASIGRQANKPTSVLITDMSQPLGQAVGNALEVEEAIQVLRGEVTGDLKRVALALAAEMLVAAGLSEGIDRAEARLEAALNNGDGLQRLQRMIELLGGDPRVCDDSALLPRAAETVMLKADRAGYLIDIDSVGIGQAAQLLGAGRSTKDDTIDPAVGLEVKVRLGDRIEAGMPVAELHVNRRDHLEAAVEKVRGSLTVDDQIPRAPELIYARIRSREE
ncbi:MAG: thymidine phosphorylase [Desulfofustis sp.]|nr:thymidine phosphorylase [Desulfofustis sp.]